MSCHSLQDSICSPFTGSIKTNPESITNKEDFSKLVQQLECPGLYQMLQENQNTVLRYYTTFQCHSLIQQHNCTVPEVMCQEECSMFQQSLQTAFVTHPYCNLNSPLYVLQHRQEYINQITKTCGLDSQPQHNCVRAVKEDMTNCGYGTSSSGKEEARKWCEQRPFELCCRDLGHSNDSPQVIKDGNGHSSDARNNAAPQVVTNTQRNPPQVADAAPQVVSDTTQLNTTIISLSAACAVLLLLCVFFIVRLVLKKKVGVKPLPPPPKSQTRVSDTRQSQLLVGKSPLDTRHSVYQVIVTHDYKAEKEDEIDLCKGDRILVSCIYADGWAMGTTVDSGKIGLFPVVCVSTL